MRLIRHATSLGGVESSLERRAVQPGQEHLPESLIRLSVGIEDDGLSDGGNPRPETLRDPLTDDRDAISLSPVAAACAGIR